MKAIETRYKGYRFRSRLEARWAVFFDALNIRWEYEPEGFELSDGTRYLPDFWLPQPEFRFLVDIKPLPDDFDGQPWIAEGTKEYKFFAEVWGDGLEGTGTGLPEPFTGANFLVIYGTPGPVDNGYPSRESSYAATIGFDSPYLLCECECCGTLGFQFDGRDGRNLHPKSCPTLKFPGDKGTYNTNSHRILSAAEDARSVRFEHNEKKTLCSA